MEKDLFGEEIKNKKSLADRFLIAPVSVINTRTGEWQALKMKYRKMGIKSEIGRDLKKNKANDWSRKKMYFKGIQKTEPSIFDPALCELMYKWFCPESGTILDPFAGGSVRGIVANYLGYKYTGIELREEQVNSNREQAVEILEVNNQPQWYIGDSNKILSDKWTLEFDFLFSCPPYMDLEIYSELDEDLSNMNDECFIQSYESIIKKSTDLLKNNSYAVFVVGDVRDKNGMYKDLITITKLAFYKCGLKLYNEIILVNPVATKAITVGQYFDKNKKVAKCHQNILVFKKCVGKNIV